MDNNYCDIIIIGGGAAGYTAAIYASRAGLSSVIFEGGSQGGQMGITSEIENYPGFESVSGFELATKMMTQAKKLGAQMRHERVTGVSPEGAVKTVTTSSGEYRCGAVIISTGARPRLLGVPGEREYSGHGVSYCATCDGGFFRGRDVAVCGGGDTAFEDAMYLSGICRRVYIIHRRDVFRASAAAVEKASSRENVEFILNSTVTEVTGDGVRVNGVIIKHNDGTENSLPCAGVFVAVGRIPESGIVSGMLTVDASGYIVADETCRTSVGGVFAAGDVRTKSLRQIVTACADGAVAVKYANEWLDSIKTQ